MEVDVFWGTGMRLDNERANESLRVAFDTPYLNLPLRSATVFPGDLVLFQARDEIAVLDIRQRKVGFLTKGTSPLGVLVPAALGSCSAD